jgi:surface protein
MLSLLTKLCNYEDALYLQIKDKICFRPQTKDELQRAINLWCSNRQEAIHNYGYINKWDTSKITDISRLFSCKCSSIFDYTAYNGDEPYYNGDEPYYKCTCLKQNFNDDINDWDVSNVTDMSATFFDCKLFNQPLNKWKTSKVKIMRAMFGFCRRFNQPLDSWDVSNVKDFGYMFLGCRHFVQPLKSWNLKDRSKNISYMFDDCPPIPRD